MSHDYAAAGGFIAAPGPTSKGKVLWLRVLGPDGSVELDFLKPSQHPTQLAAWLTRRACPCRECRAAA